MRIMQGLNIGKKGLLAVAKGAQVIATPLAKAVATPFIETAKLAAKPVTATVRKAAALKR
jgi:hypothetical protein